MTESWRVKKYYDKRVLIDVDRVLTPQYDDALLCITGAQLEMLRNLTQYLHRRSTFVSEYDVSTYLIADNDDWDDISDIVADLENTIMGCEELLVQMTLIAQGVNGQTAPTSITPEMVDYYIDEDTLQYEDDNKEETTAGESARCGTAQLAFAFAYELLTETIQPAQSGAIDYLLPLALLAIASWVGGPAIGIPVGGVLALFSAVARAWEAGQLENISAGLWAAKEELVCAVYQGLETDSGTASIAAGEIIEDLPGWSPIDILVGHLLFAPWAIVAMDKARIADTAWASNNISEGYCIDCEDVVEGSDWYARPVAAIDGTHTLNHTVGDYWQYICHEFVQVADEIACGMVFEVTELTGDCDCGRTSPNNGGCDGNDGITQNTTETLPEDVYFTAVPDNIDEAECKTALAATATSRLFSVRTAADGHNYAAFGYGWSCTGTIEIVVKYIIYEGSPP